MAAGVHVRAEIGHRIREWRPGVATSAWWLGAGGCPKHEAGRLDARVEHRRLLLGNGDAHPFQSRDREAGRALALVDLAVRRLPDPVVVPPCISDPGVNRIEENVRE